MNQSLRFSRWRFSGWRFSGWRFSGWRFFGLYLALIAGLLASLPVSAQEISEQEKRDGFEELFNGKDLAGWKGALENYFVENGELVRKQGAGGVLFTEEQFADFEVRLEYLLPPGGNNGLAIRYPGTGRASVDAMCEIQILDDEAEIYKDLDPRQYTGAVYGMIAPQRGKIKPAGQWNDLRVKVIGPRIIVHLNEHEILNGDVSTVTEFKDNQLHPGKDRQSGHFGFAGHDDPIRFRNIRLKSIPKFEICTFSLDVTIPLGHRCMGILPQKSVRVSDPLYAHGFALFGAEKPLAVIAVDWCEIRNGSYDQWRDTVAEAIGTTRDRVFVSSLHQHDAPVIDRDAAALLDAEGLHNELFDSAFHNDVLKRLRETIDLASQQRQPITDIGYASTTVVGVASNRRIEHPDGSINFARGSSSGREPFFREAPTGLIDDQMRTISFWNVDKCLVEYHCYATHPMSYYGRGEVTSDFVGLARQRRQRETPGTLQIYASGCSGDVTAGKFNDGTPAAREELTAKIHMAMVQARQNTERSTAMNIRFSSTNLKLDYTQLPHLQPAQLEAELADTSLPTERRILAAMGLASYHRVLAQRAIDMPVIDFGSAKMVLFPGESFVGYQHIAQEYGGGKPVIPIGYGECWTGYVPTAAGVADGFNESWMWVDTNSEERIRGALAELMKPLSPMSLGQD
jgi:hypothetical protein